MTYIEAFESPVLAVRPSLARLRQLCDESYPDVEARDGYRSYVIRRAMGQPEPSPAAPTVRVDYGLARSAATPCCGG